MLYITNRTTVHMNDICANIMFLCRKKFHISILLKQIPVRMNGSSSRFIYQQRKKGMMPRCSSIYIRFWNSLALYPSLFLSRSLSHCSSLSSRDHKDASMSTFDPWQHPSTQVNYVFHNPTTTMFAQVSNME